MSTGQRSAKLTRATVSSQGPARGSCLGRGTVDRVRSDFVETGPHDVVVVRGPDPIREYAIHWATSRVRAVQRLALRGDRARVNFADRCPVDIGQGYMMDYIQTLNAGSLWDKLTAVPPSAAH